MKYTPLISICMPVYNAGPYLTEALEGAISQTYQNLEIVICDNCSTDQSVEIAKDYANRYPDKIHFYQNTWNIGYTGNANKTTRLSAGDFLIMHGADDYLMEAALEKYVGLINACELDHQNLILMSDYVMGDAQGNKKFILTLHEDNDHLIQLPLNTNLPPQKRVELLHGHDVLNRCFPELRSFGGVGSVMVSRRLFEKVEGYHSNHWFNPDKYFIYKVLSLNPNILWLREPLYYYRVHETNQLSQQSITGALKQLSDEYFYTFEFPEDFYSSFGSREKVIRQFVEDECLNSSLREIANGNHKQGFRNLCFALATYPDYALKNYKTYSALMLWLTGPLGHFVARSLYQIKTGKKNKQIH